MDIDLEKKYKLAWEKIKTAKNILIVSHLHPDADAIASIGVLIDLITGLEKNFLALAVAKEEMVLSYIPHEEKVHGVLPENFNYTDFDLVIVVDCGSVSRTVLENSINNKPNSQFIIEFDHHPKVDNYANLEIKVPEAAATAEILYDFIKVNQLAITKNIANCLAAGVLNDTGNFIYPSTSDKSVRIVSEMVELGAQLPRVIKNTYQNKNLTSLKLWGLALKNLKINTKYNIAVSVLTKTEILETAEAKALSEINNEVFGDIVGFLSNLYGVSAILLLREENNRIKANIRTASPDIDVSIMAQMFGGGGHPKASGFVVNGQILKTDNGWQIKN